MSFNSPVESRIKSPQTLTVLSVNDAPPLFTYTTTPAAYLLNSAISANDPILTGGTITSFAITPALPTGLSFNTTTGRISGTPTALTPAANFTVTGTGNGGSATATVNVTVIDAAPAFTYTTNPAVYVKGTAITANSPINSGGAVISYAVSPSLPSGLSLNTTTGSITGTPSAVAANATYTVTATNSGGSATTGVQIRVKDVAPAFTYALNPAVYIRSSSIVSNSPINTGGAVISYAVSPALPAGLSFNTSTGAITGTSTVLSPIAAYTVTATNSGGSTSVGVQITVTDAAPSFTYLDPAPVYTKLVAISPANTPVNSGGAVVSYSIAPTLPAGISLNTSTGAITGTPTVLSSTGNYTITGTNSGGSATATVSLTVAPPFHTERQLKSGWDHNCFLDSDGSVRCWGDNSVAQIHPISNEDFLPALVPGLTIATTIPSVTLTPYTPVPASTLVAAGSSHTCAVHSGTLQCWGTTLANQLGITPTYAALSPFAVFISGVEAVTLNGPSTCATISGALKCFGQNDFGQTGNGSTSTYNTTPTTVFSSGVTDASLGTSHACAIVSGALQCWGRNNVGQIGKGTANATNILSPYTVFASGATSVDAGSNHTCAIVSGALYCWGQNSAGQIGKGSTSTSVNSPYQVFASGIAAVSAGSTHTCVIDISGALKCWGNNGSGRIGNGSAGSNVLTPFTVFSSGVTAVSAGADHTCAIVSGAMKCWGGNTRHQSGDPASTASVLSPIAVFDSSVSSISAGAQYTCAVVSGLSKCWGEDGAGQIGHGTTSIYSTSSPFMALGLVVQGVGYDYAGAQQFRPLSSGYNHVCAVTPTGGLKCWGGNDSGQVGTGAASDSELSAVEVFTSGVTSVSVGYGHTCAVVSGSLQCFGNNAEHEFSASTNPGILTPFTVFKSGVTAVFTGFYNTCAIVSGGLHCFGNNYDSQTDFTSPDTGNAITPKTLFASGVSDVALGGEATCAVVLGSLQCFGRNSSGQIGNGTEDSTTPVTIPYTVFASGVTGVAAGYAHFCAISSGALWCWGNNGSGQIGNGVTGGNVDTPFEVFSSGVTAVSAGAYHTCAVVSGALYCFGANESGEIGNGQYMANSPDPTSPNVPSPFLTISSGVSFVSAGSQFTCATVSGQIECFGLNYNGQLGKGTVFGAIQSPYTVFASGVSAIALGGGSTCAVISGSLRCFGSNYSGQIGTGTTSIIPVSQTTVFSSGVTDVAAGSDHTCAIVSGALKCFGANDYGQIGNGTTSASEPTPYTVFSSGVEKLYVSGYTNCALKSDQTLWCFGYASQGLFNDGDNLGTAHPTPTQVTLPSGTLVDFSLGSNHACGIFDQSGTKSLICWGGNNSGQIVDDSIYGSGLVSQTVLTSATLEKVTVGSLASGETCFSDAGIWKCKGNNYYGGIDLAQSQSAVYQLNNFVTIFSGASTLLVGIDTDYNTCVLVNDQVLCQGMNYQGNLGQNVPLRVSGSGFVLNSVGP